MPRVLAVRAEDGRWLRRVIVNSLRGADNLYMLPKGTVPVLFAARHRVLHLSETILRAATVNLDPRLQSALGDRYTIEQELGRGGMAVVYLATDHKLDRQVALKVLRPEVAESLGAERLRREITIAAKLAHPNILTLHDCGGDEPCLYYTMQYVEGETLRDRLRREKQLPVEDAVQIAKDVSAALSHAHAQGIVHRDIKPENILFYGGHAVVADFGIAKAVSEVGGEPLTVTGIAVGTPAYMSPEQAAGERDLDGRTDLYALGCVLYEMLAGEPPFTGPTAQAIVAKKLSEAVPRVSVVREAVPANVEEALAKALAKTPTDRYATAEQFSAALRSRSTAAAGKAPRRITRLTAVVGVLAVATLASGAFGAWWFFTPGRPGTLWAAGVLDAQEPIVLADFGTRSVDSALIFTVTDAFRVDLSQSRTVRLLDHAVVADVLRLMERDPTHPLDVGTARELAMREGLKGVIAGEINSVGSGYALSVRLVVAGTGEELTSFRETASGPDAVIPAIERLSRRLRDRIGESLKTVRQTPRLWRVKTASLEALRRHTEGSRANNSGDYERCVTLLTDAITLDTLFADAYLMRGFCYNNLGLGIGLGSGGYTDLIRAFELRNRMTAFGQAWATAAYYGLVRGEHARAAETLEAYLDLYPDDLRPLNNLSVDYSHLRKFARAEEVLLQCFDALAMPSGAIWVNLVVAQLNQGKFAAAEETLRRWEETMPANDMIVGLRFSLAASRRDYEGAQSVLDAPIEIPYWRAISSYSAAGLAGVQGKLREFVRHLQNAPLSGYERLKDIAFARLIAGDTTGAVAAMEEGLALAESLAPEDRPYLDPAGFFAYAGRPSTAREFLDVWDRLADENQKSRELAERRGNEGVVILAEGRPEDAIPLLRFAHEHMPLDPIAYLGYLGAAYEQAGKPDSALATYERYLNTPYSLRLTQDVFWLPIVYERLAALYERRGEVEQALEFYGKFVDLWSEADPELQPRVEEARAAMERLVAERG